MDYRDMTRQPFDRHPEGRAARVRRLHEAVVGGDRDNLARAREIGEELLEEREACTREQRGWYDWLREVGIDPRRAQEYMAIAKAYRDGRLSADSADVGFSEALILIRREEVEATPEPSQVVTGPSPGEDEPGSAADDEEDAPPDTLRLHAEPDPEPANTKRPPKPQAPKSGAGDPQERIWPVPVKLTAEEAFLAMAGRVAKDFGIPVAANHGHVAPTLLRALEECDRRARPARGRTRKARKGKAGG
jgi:hypothetical protein